MVATTYCCDGMNRLTTTTGPTGAVGANLSAAPVKPATIGYDAHGNTTTVGDAG